LAAKARRACAADQRGPLYFLSVKDHELFSRDGAYDYVEVPIPMAPQRCGDIEVPSIGGGRAKVAIKPGTQTGTHSVCAQRGCRW